MATKTRKGLSISDVESLCVIGGLCVSVVAVSSLMGKDPAPTLSALLGLGASALFLAAWFLRANR